MNQNNYNWIRAGMNFYARSINSLLKFGYRLLYNELNWTYDWVAALVSAGDWNDWILSVLPYLDGPKVLEIGHGPGHLMVKLRELGIFSVGIDASWRMSLMLFRRLLERGFVMFLVNGYAQYLPFPNDQFNQVISTFPSDYIYDRLTLNAIFRVLTPGGSFIILPAAWIHGDNIFHRISGQILKIANPPHSTITEYLDTRLLAPLREIGFNVQTEMNNLEESTVLIVIAQKPLLAL